MPVSAETLSILMAKGIVGDDLLEVVRAMERDMGDVTRVMHSDARSPAAKRQAEYRLRKRVAAQADITEHNARDVTRDVTNVTERDADPVASRVRGEVLPTSLDSNISPTKEPPKGGSKGKVLSPDWQPSDEDRAYAVSRGLTGQRLERTIENFRDYWTARAGAAALKRDWSATWRTWVRRELERTETPPARAGPRSTSNGFSEVLDELRGASVKPTNDPPDLWSATGRTQDRSSAERVPQPAGGSSRGDYLDLRPLRADTG